MLTCPQIHCTSKKLVGDLPALEEWESTSPGIIKRAGSREEMEVLGLPPGRLREEFLPVNGFRPANLGEIDVVVAREPADER